MKQILHSLIFTLLTSCILLTSCTKKTTNLYYIQQDENQNSILQLNLKQQKFYINSTDSLNNFSKSGKIIPSQKNKYWTLEFPFNSENEILSPFNNKYILIDTLSSSEQIEIDFSFHELSTNKPKITILKLISPKNYEQVTTPSDLYPNVSVTTNHQFKLPETFEGLLLEFKDFQSEKKRIKIPSKGRYKIKLYQFNKNRIATGHGYTNKESFTINGFPKLKLFICKENKELPTEVSFTEECITTYELMTIIN